MQTITALKSAVLPYLGVSDLDWIKFASRNDQRPYQTNTLLSQQKSSRVKDPGKTLVLFQSLPERFGRRRWVLFLDGTVQLIWETDWPAIKQASGIR